MKKRNDLGLFLLCGLITLALGILTLKAQNAPAAVGQNETKKFSGSSVKTEDVALKCEAVFIGQITEMGPPVARAAGQAAYYGVQVKILQILRGSIDAPVVVTLLVTRLSTIQENPPTVGSSYIFFVNTKGHVSVLKLLEATDDNIAKVKKLIAAAPTHK